MRTVLTIMSVICFLLCLVVVATIKSKSSRTLSKSDDNHEISYVTKSTGHFNRRAITGADGQTDIPNDRIERNNFSTIMIQDMRGVSSTSTMSLP